MTKERPTKQELEKAKAEKARANAEAAKEAAFIEGEAQKEVDSPQVTADQRKAEAEGMLAAQKAAEAWEETYDRKEAEDQRTQRAAKEAQEAEARKKTSKTSPTKRVTFNTEVAVATYQPATEVLQGDTVEDLKSSPKTTQKTKFSSKSPEQRPWHTRAKTMGTPLQQYNKDGNLLLKHDRNGGSLAVVNSRGELLSEARIDTKPFIIIKDNNFNNPGEAGEHNYLMVKLGERTVNAQRLLDDRGFITSLAAALGNIGVDHCNITIVGENVCIGPKGTDHKVVDTVTMGRCLEAVKRSYDEFLGPTPRTQMSEVDKARPVSPAAEAACTTTYETQL